MSSLHPAYVGERLRYDADTGKLYWREYEPMGRRWNTRYAGTEAFTTLHESGYLRGKIDDHRYMAHIIAWTVYWGMWPLKQIDHLNHVRIDNRMDNMRLATYTDQRRNQSLRPTNEVGCHGVFWEEDRNKWKVTIKDEGRTINLGRFASLNDAIEVRKFAEYAMGYHHNHGAVCPV